MPGCTFDVALYTLGATSADVATGTTEVAGGFVVGVVPAVMVVPMLVTVLVAVGVAEVVLVGLL